MTETPITFSVWASVQTGKQGAALADLLHRRPGVSPSTAGREVRNAGAGRPLLLEENVPWSTVQALRTAHPEWINELTVFQAGYGPQTDHLSHCDRHLIHYAGALGCHVCRGFYCP